MEPDGIMASCPAADSGVDGRFLMLTVKEFAARLGYAPKSIRKAIKDGNLKAVRLGPRGTYLIPESELRRILEGA